MTPTDEARAAALAAFSSAELQAELRRRKDRPAPPAFRCERCGAEGRYVGPFKTSWFEVQYRCFQDRHRHCKAYFGGGGI